MKFTHETWHSWHQESKDNADVLCAECRHNAGGHGWDKGLKCFHGYKENNYILACTCIQFELESLEDDITKIREKYSK